MVHELEALGELLEDERPECDLVQVGLFCGVEVDPERALRLRKLLALQPDHHFVVSRLLHLLQPQPLRVRELRLHVADPLLVGVVVEVIPTITVLQVAAVRNV